MYSTQGVMINAQPLVGIIIGFLGLCVAALAVNFWHDRRLARRKPAPRNRRPVKKV
jgi:hypothetical protein